MEVDHEPDDLDSDVDEELRKMKFFFPKFFPELRRELRAQAYRVPANHEHTYGEEQKSEDNEDEYFKECSSCGYKLVFEKL